MTTLGTRSAPARFAALSRQQEQALATLALAKSIGPAAAVAAAENTVFTAYVMFATALANRYCRRGVDADDLRQLSFLGLLKAIRRWDPLFGAEFLAFAYPVVLGEIRRYFRDQLNFIRMPRLLMELHSEIVAVREQLQSELGRVATDDELALAARVTPERIRAAKTASFRCRTASLDNPDVYGAAVTSVSANAASDLRQVEDRIVMGQAVASLTQRERQIVDLRYVHELSQVQIGTAIGVSQMQVSRILRGIHLKLRTNLARP